MFRLVRLGANVLLIAASLPLLALSLLIAVLDTICHALLMRFGTRHGNAGMSLRRLWAENEFRFENAVPLYEDLIDSYAERQS